MSDITRSEAIKQLRLLKADITHGLAFISKTKDKHPALESLDMAIASLETDEAYQLEYEPTTKNDLGVDCISREQALKELKESAEHHANDSREEVLLRRDRDIIRALPSVTPQEPRKGHWINKDYLFNSCSAECSSCHKRSNGYQHDNGFSLDFKYYDFCPNCGSDNREVVEE